MKVSHIEVKNFKTFGDISVDLNNSNVIIGACASGKSHFIEIFKFLKDISNDFEDAIVQHGSEHLTNYNYINQEKPSYFKVLFKNGDDVSQSLSINNPKFSFNENEYLFIKFNEIKYEVLFKPFNFGFCDFLKESVEFSCDFYKLNNNDNTLNESCKIQENTIYLKNIEGEISAELKNESILTISDLIPDYLLNTVQMDLKADNTPIINSSLSSMPINWNQFFRDIKYYDFNPRFTKYSLFDDDSSYLSELGGNLSNVLNGIIKDHDKKRKFLNLLDYLLPYINELDIGKSYDGRDIFKIVENYNNVLIPSYLVSDGTSNIIALIVALYFEKGKIILIEEPERNIHPELLSKLVQMINEVSHEKQVIITTHSPEMLKYFDLADIYFISRDCEGFSNISKPENNEIIKPFIEELGIDEVFIDNYLGLGND